MNRVFEYQSLGLSPDDDVHRLKNSQLGYIKVAVDGIDHLRPRGGKPALSLVNDGFHEQVAQCQKPLEEAGTVLKKRRHLDTFNHAYSFGSGQVWNQIWIRN